MGIQTGTQLIAPEGFHMLEQDAIYYFLRSDPKLQTVLLIQFLIRKPRPINVSASGKIKHQTPIPFPLLLRMSRDDFERGIEIKSIVCAEHQAMLPPWLEPLEGLPLYFTDECRPNAKQQHSARIDQRVTHIYPLVKQATEILRSQDPDLIISRHARGCEPKQNETRVRLWFYVYLLFGRNRFALHYPIHRIGHWDRLTALTTKRGTPSKYKGKMHGCNVDAEILRKIMEGYNRFAKLGVPLKTVYQRSMTAIFKCQVIDGEDGYKHYIQPDGKPIPQLNQFSYYINREIGNKIVRQTVIGRMRERTELLPSIGKFTSCVANLLERTESDGYYFPELPKGYLEGNPLPPLCMVRTRDFASGAIIGIGFSINSERASAYRISQFCASINKVKFCSLFGIAIQAHEWPTIGLSTFLSIDRGPGTGIDALPHDIKLQPIFRELAPSYSGQSKAVIESSHPKTISNRESPSYIQSNLTPVEMVRREIFRVLRDNDSINIADRITPDLVGKVTRPSPNALWSTLDTLGRNDGYQISFEDAVRNFLTPITVTVKSNGVYLHSQYFDSPSLRLTGILDKVAKSQQIQVQAYLLEACVRHIWIEYQGRVIELDMQIALRTSKEVLYVSLEQLKEMEYLRKKSDNAFASHRHAIASEFEARFKEDTGQEWDSGSRHAGRPKRNTAMAKQEAREADGAMRAKDAA